MDSYLKAIEKHLKGKYVEVYLGDTHRKNQLADFENEIKSTIFGKVVDVEGYCLILEVKRNKDKGLVFLNSWMIGAITEPASGISINDAFIPSSDLAGKRGNKSDTKGLKSK